jgi:hypothetical protein
MYHQPIVVPGMWAKRILDADQPFFQEFGQAGLSPDDREVIINLSYSFLELLLAFLPGFCNKTKPPTFKP